MRLSHFLLAGVLFAAASCGSSADKPAGEAAAPRVRGKVESKMDEAGTAAVMHMVGQYYMLKNALVATNAAQTTSGAVALAKEADSLRTALKASPVYDGISAQMDTLIMQSMAISQIADPTCEAQRIAFSPLSDALFSLLRKVEVKNAGVYRQYCPMAFNDKGAHWLSDIDEIKNPYFGKKMLECGEVQDSL